MIFKHTSTGSQGSSLVADAIFIRIEPFENQSDDHGLTLPAAHQFLGRDLPIFVRVPASEDSVRRSSTAMHAPEATSSDVICPSSSAS